MALPNQNNQPHLLANSSIGYRSQTLRQFFNETARIECNWSGVIPTHTHQSSQQLGDVADQIPRITKVDLYNRPDPWHGHTPRHLLEHYINKFGNTQIRYTDITQYHCSEADMGFTAAENDYKPVIQAVASMMPSDSPYRLEIHPAYNPRPSVPQGGTGQGHGAKMDYNIFLVPKTIQAGTPITPQDELQLPTPTIMMQQNHTARIVLAGVENKEHAANRHTPQGREWAFIGADNDPNREFIGGKANKILSQARSYTQRYNCPYVFIDDYARPISLWMTDYTASQQMTVPATCPRDVKFQDGGDPNYPGFRHALAACLISLLYRMGLMRDLCFMNVRRAYIRMGRGNEVEDILGVFMAKEPAVQEHWNSLLLELNVWTCSQQALTRVWNVSNALRGDFDSILRSLLQPYDLRVHNSLRFLTEQEKGPLANTLLFRTDATDRTMAYFRDARPAATRHLRRQLPENAFEALVNMSNNRFWDFFA